MSLLPRHAYSRITIIRFEAYIKCMKLQVKCTLLLNNCTSLSNILDKNHVFIIIIMYIHKATLMKEIENVMFKISSYSVQIWYNHNKLRKSGRSYNYKKLSDGEKVYSFFFFELEPLAAVGVPTHFLGNQPFIRTPFSSSAEQWQSHINNNYIYIHKHIDIKIYINTQILYIHMHIHIKMHKYTHIHIHNYKHA